MVVSGSVVPELSVSFEADPSVLSVVFVSSVPFERSEFVVAPSLSDSGFAV